MLEHPAIDKAVEAFDIIEGSMTDLYNMAREAGVTPEFTENFGKQITKWVDGYMEAFKNLRSADTLELYTKAHDQLMKLYDHGNLFYTDFRTLAVAECHAMVEQYEQLERETSFKYLVTSIWREFSSFFRIFRKS